MNAFFKLVIPIYMGLLVVLNVSAQITPLDMIAKMGRGINLGNTLSAPVEGNWQPIVEQTYFEDIKAAGFTTVRIPADFFGYRTTGNTEIYSKATGTAGDYSGTPSDYIVDSSYLDRIEEVIGWALTNNLVVILDFHGKNLKDEFLHTFSPKAQFTTFYTDPTSAKRVADNEKFRAIWAQIAERFKTYSDDLVFEVVNEPYFFLTKTEMDILNFDIINIIRSTGEKNTNRNIIITGGGKNSYEAPLQINNSILAMDNHLIATFHYYLPRDFTASSSTDNNDFDWGTVSDKATVDDHFNIVFNWSQTNDIPVILGEFGADNECGYDYETGLCGPNGGPDKNSRVAYHNYLANAALNRGFAFTAWDAGHKSNKTIYIVTDRNWVEEVKNALLGQVLSTNSEKPYSDDLIVYPNPVKNTIHIKSVNKIKYIQLFDLTGSEKLQVECTDYFTVSNLNPGLYLVTVSFENGFKKSEKILIP